MSRHRALVLASTLAVCLVAVVSRAPIVFGAESTNDLGAIGFGSIVVDAAREHVLVSGPAASVVDVLDYSGRLVRTIQNLYGAYGMVVKGRYLYVAESTAGEIVRVNLAKPRQAVVPLATGLDNPHWLVMTGGRLWVTTGPYNEGVLASVDPRTGAVRSFPVPYGSYGYELDVAVSPGAPASLFLTQDGLSPGSVYRLNVASGIPELVASNRENDLNNIRGLAVSPDGTRVIPAAGAPYYFEEFSASTLQPDAIQYPGPAYPKAVAVSGPKSNLLATGIEASNEPSETDIKVDPIGTPVPIFSATTTNALGSHVIADHGLALTPDGMMLFAVYWSEIFRGETWLSTFSVPT